MGKSNAKTWEEIVFEHRNRDYGAYALRFQYPRYLTVSALIVILLFLTVMLGLNIFGVKKERAHHIKKVLIMNYNELSEPPPIEKTYVPPPPKQVVMSQEKVEKIVPPKVIEEEIEEPEEEIIEEEAKEVMDPTDRFEESDNSEGIETETETPPEPFFDINPAFPSGGGSFMDWLDKNLRYPVAAKRMGIEGTVIVEFLVDENGKISEVAIFESLHRLCDREAIRLVKIMPLWMPGMKNGVKIRGKHILEIPFVIK
jgi:protein TonB